MLAAMISDAHLNGLDDPNQGRLTALLDSFDAPQVFLLGDLFQWWWGGRDLAFAEHRPVMDALARLQGRGAAVHFVPGNHDFGAAPLFRELGIVVSDRIEVELGGRRFVLIHGDEADRTLGYRLTRRLLRGPAYAGLMRLVGPARAQRIGLGLAGASYVGEPNASLIEAQVALAVEELGAADVVVMGHSHAPDVRALPGGTYVNLGDFLHQHTWLSVGEDGLELRRA
ncbi:MAG TPA: UDP-2,3-diacylglucosamine diphosphatase [Myxococcota bacterium]|nr:UDP-2,3-diacylglucosamine diphosphatase [Myxococcota bacterium]